MKNKIAPPFKQCEFDIMFAKGISREGTLLDVATEFGIVRKSGAWYTYEGEQIGQGRENAKVFLAENLELMIEISEKVRQKVGVAGTATPDTQAEEERNLWPSKSERSHWAGPRRRPLFRLEPTST